MKRLARLSLRLRLTLLFAVLTTAAWGMASVIAWQQTSKKLDKLFDTQQLLFARRLSVMHFDELRAPPALLGEKKKVRHGHIDDDALAFAIFTRDGKMVLNDGERIFSGIRSARDSAMAICVTTMTSGVSCG